MRPQRPGRPEVWTRAARQFLLVDLMSGRLGPFLRWLSVILAYVGGAIVSALGIMSAISIIGRSAISRPVTGDFELVEIGIAVAGSLFLPYCQLTSGHIVVDFFTQRASPRTIRILDQFGALLMAIMLLVVGWRTAVAAIDIARSGETSMLLGFPTWIGYAAAVPGVIVAGIIALLQSIGLVGAERVVPEVGHE
jgi:TRAP-type C4-dicarboxylate transport system permease small subunit